MDKLYVIVREDLPQELQITQLCNSLGNFILQHQELGQQWMKKSNSIICLNAKNESELQSLLQKTEETGLCFSRYLEPQLKDELTSITIQHSDKCAELFGNLPKALGEL